ncbi:MAG: sugar phosphate isomerase/epimerase family protein, partial [Solirubrobacterales bacterium]
EVTDNLHLAAELGASRVVTIAGRRNPLFPAPLELTWELGRQSIERCVEIAAGCQVLLCLEPIPYSFLSTGAEVRRMIEAIGSPWLRGLIDTANSHATEGVAAAAAGLGDLLAHVQFSDTFKGEFRHDPVGSCEIDFGAALEAIVGTGYAGPYVLELCCPEDPDGALQLSAERLRPLGFTL